MYKGIINLRQMGDQETARVRVGKGAQSTVDGWVVTSRSKGV